MQSVIVSYSARHWSEYFYSDFDLDTGLIFMSKTGGWVKCKSTQSSHTLLQCNILYNVKLKHINIQSYTEQLCVNNNIKHLAYCLLLTWFYVQFILIHFTNNTNYQLLPCS